MDTIFAQATALGRAGVSVVRISGPDAHDITRALCGDVPEPRLASVRDIVDRDGTLVDQALVLTFNGPNSFTGEDVAELHLHGSIAIVQAVLRLLGTFQNSRLAEPGEFTRRALENDRMDLTQVEGLGDLIEAETEAQRSQAMNVLSGKLAHLIEGWRADLIRAAALLEATIDFADEDVPVDVTPEVSALLARVVGDLEIQIAGVGVSERIRTGFEIAILGAPNVGKSTLLNALAGRDAAITSAIAGTTRDVIEVRMDLGGLPVTILDTAGLRDTEDEIESQGIKRALSRAANADLRVLLAEPDHTLQVELTKDDIEIRPKADLLVDKVGAVSGVSGEGIDALVERIKATLLNRASTAGLATHERHRIAMENASVYLGEASKVLAFGPDHYEIAAAELRFSIRALEALVGRIDTENLLDEIFSSFCLGK